MIRIDLDVENIHPKPAWNITSKTSLDAIEYLLTTLPQRPQDYSQLITGNPIGYRGLVISDGGLVKVRVKHEVVLVIRPDETLVLRDTSMALESYILNRSPKQVSSEIIARILRGDS